MKKIFLIFLFVCVTAVAGAAYFVATFDANAYKPRIIAELQKALQKPVDIGSVNLKLSGGLYLSFKNVRIFDELNKAVEVVNIPSLDLKVRLMPLLHKDVQVVAINIEGPKLKLEKRPDGSLNILPSKQGQGGASKKTEPSSNANVAQGLFLSIDKISIISGEFSYVDLSVKPQLALKASKINVVANNFSLNSPFDVSGSLALLSDSANIDFRTSVSLSSTTNPDIVLSNVYVGTDLGKLSLQDMTHQIASLKSLGLNKMEGQLDLKAEMIGLSQAISMGSGVEIALSKGYLQASQLPAPIDNLSLVAILKENSLLLRSLYYDFAGGAVRLEGLLDNLRSAAAFNGKLNLSQLAIDKLYKQPSKNVPYLVGRLSMDSSLRFTGLDQEMIKKTLSGQGQVELRDAAVVNFNALRQVLDKIQSVPGVGPSLTADLPTNIVSILQKDSTPIYQTALPFVVDKGVFTINPVTLRSDAAALSGVLQYSLDQNIRSQGVVSLSPEISMFVASRAPLLASAMSAQQTFDVPFTASGIIPNVAIKPDFRGLTQRVIATQANAVVTEFIKDPSAAKDNIANLLKKGVGGAETQVGNASAQAAPTLSKTEQKINQISGILQGVLGGSSSETSTNSN